MKEKAAQLTAEVAELLRQAQAADDEEDRRYGKDKRGDELPQELAFREGRLEKIREAMAALEAEAQAAAEQAEAEGGKPPGGARQGTSVTHRYRVAHHPRTWRKGLPASVQLSGGGGQRSPGDRGGAGHQPDFG